MLVLNADHPLVDAGTLLALVDGAPRGAARRRRVLTFDRTETIGGDFGRIVRDAAGERRGDRRAARRRRRPARAARGQRRATTCSAATGCGPRSSGLTARQRPGRAVPDRRRRRSWPADGAVVHAHRHDDPLVAKGVNTRADLAEAAAELRARINRGHMLAGVTIVDPATHLHRRRRRDRGRTRSSHPFTVLRGATRVGAGAQRRAARRGRRRRDRAEMPWSARSATFGPGAVLERGAKAGTLVEIKNPVIGEGAKVPHLSYIGDAEIGAGSNIGRRRDHRQLRRLRASSAPSSARTSTPALIMSSSRR